MNKKISQLGVTLAIIYWTVDALTESLLSANNVNFTESFFTPSAEKLWIRGFVVALFLIFTAYTERLLRIINKIKKELETTHKRLEQTVNELHMEMDERRVAIEELEQLAITDPLTSLFNRRKFNELLAYEVERNQRYNAGLSLIMCDIDHFKKINDKFGHTAGDSALKTFSDKVTENIRDVDIFARWGGEEFMILMPNSNIDSACSVAEKLRNAIEHTSINTIDTLTASFGVAHCNNNDTTESIVERVDAALYEAKQQGRNTVVAAA